MKCTCELRPRSYPNCTRLKKIVETWNGGCGELEIVRHGILPRRVSLVFREPAGGQKISMWMWAVESRYFKTPSLFDELLKITTHFLMIAMQEAHPPEFQRKAPGLSRKRLMLHQSRVRLSDALQELRPDL